jgi:hypothetical protein
VDSQTTQHIYRECLRGNILKDRIVMLVTHQIDLCKPAANSVIHIANGLVSQERQRPALPQPPSVINPPKRDKLANRSAAPSGKLYAAEPRETGRVRSSHYAMLLTAAGGASYWAALFGVILLCCLFKDSRQYVLRLWTERNNPDRLQYYLSVYTAVTLVACFLGAFRWFLLYGIGNVGMYNRGVKVIHRSLIERLAAAPLRFFDTTPKGRLLNVLTMDVQRLDWWSADTLFRESHRCPGLIQPGTISETAQVVVSLALMCYFQPVRISKPPKAKLIIRNFCLSLQP